jgi:RNA polymerase sigma factor (sigma-70 family)
MEQFSDLTAIARAARSGDRLAIEEFVRSVQPIVVRTVRLVVGPGSALAEDAAQEALADIVRGLPQLISAESAAGWAVRVAMRRALRAARRHDLRVHLTGRDSEIDGIPDPRSAPERMMEIRQAFDTLPARLRAVAVLRLYLGLSESETADALHCSVGTVKSRLHTARERLQRILAPEQPAPLGPLDTGRTPT